MSQHSYEIRPLAADDPDCPDHIAFIDAAEDVKGLRDMFHAVSDGCTNAAVWNDAPDLITPMQRENLRAWCDQYGLSTTQMRVSDQSLSKLFNKAAKGHYEALKPLENHVQSRLNALSKAFPDKDVNLTVRADIFQTRTTTSDGGNPHIDNGTNIDMRFIETIAGGTTCLMDNKQVIFEGKADKTRPKDEKLTYWQVPDRALTLLTSAWNSRKPVMHSAPPREKIGTGNTRIVIIYDLVERKKPVWERLQALFS